jgi:hypothetical protein
VSDTEATALILNTISNVVSVGAVVVVVLMCIGVIAALVLEDVQKGNDYYAAAVRVQKDADDRAATDSQSKSRKRR